MNFNFLCKEPAPPNGRSVGIVGAGPSGLAAAGYLSCLGYQVTVYDKLPKPGGLMRFGIPGHRITKERIEAGIRHMERQFGVVFQSHTKICCSAPLFEEEGDHFCREVLGLGDIVKRHDASIICTGAWKSRKLGIPGEDLPGVYSGLEFLFPIRAVHYCAPQAKPVEVAGKVVAVIGAGHSAVDVAHSALRLGAAMVHHLYRRTAKEAPCGSFEIERLQSMGVHWHERVTPVRILGDAHVEGIELSHPEHGAITLAVDMVVTAIGEIATPPFARELGLENVRKGEVRWLHMTDIENVFVAGDALTGPSKIGKAVYSGLKAARSLANWLDLKAQDRLDAYAYDDLMAKDERTRRR
ncbi:MAG: FAD-dependent pyridine nucleotide-disulfide oxidoreductase [Desulfomicrobiaceae bacterium]|nr:FAD-dependent pyridine nucleotide-disulfide oxidoreductase [Desulfomicrobiaceae bacterium]